MYRGGAGPTGLTNEGGARLTVAEGVALREACAGETTEYRDNNGGVPRELPPDKWEEREGG